MGSVLIRFVWLGPAIGGFMFALMMSFERSPEGALKSASALGAATSCLSSFIDAGLYGMVLAYPIGVPPAAACGLGYWFALKRTTGNFRPATRASIGGMLGLACAAAYGYALFVPDTPNSLPSVVFWAVMGAASGAGCALSITGGSYSKVLPIKRAPRAA